MLKTDDDIEELKDDDFKITAPCTDELKQLSECMLGTIPLSNQSDVFKGVIFWIKNSNALSSLL